MAATGKTPILLYGSTTATNTPSAGNLTNSSDGCEIAINVADKNLFFKDSTNTVNTVPIRQSSASSNGWLSSTDWSTFNDKAPAFTYTSNYIPYGQGTTTPTQSANLTFNGSLLNVVGTIQSNTATGGTLQLNSTVAGTTNVIGSYANNGTAFGDLYVSANSTIFTQAGAEAARFNTSGNLAFGNGKGIDFSATAGTGTSELLADYEEGTWTPTQGSGLTVVGSFSSAGTYTKIGRQVTVRATITGSTSVACSAVGQVCAGLPYTVANDTQGSFTNSNLSQGGVIDCNSTSIYSTVAITAAPTILFTVSYFV